MLQCMLSDVFVSPTSHLYLSYVIHSMLSGLRKMDIHTSFTSRGVLFDILIFIMLSLQKRVFDERSASYLRDLASEAVAAKVTTPTDRPILGGMHGLFDVLTAYLVWMFFS